MTHRTLVLAVLAGGLTVAAVACTLNPQPLPPSDFASESDSDASTRSDGGFGGENPTPSTDAATEPADAGRLDDADGGDAGDGGDGGDASDGG